jgi:glycosyltransferase involved in cell wall biosynthesis
MTAPKLVISINSAWNIVNFRAGLVRALVARGYDVLAVAPDDGHAEAVKSLGCRFTPIPMDPRGVSPVHDARLLLAYRALLMRERPDAFLGYTIKPNVYGSLAARALGIPVINNIAGLGTAFLDEGWLNRLARGLYRVALRRSATVFFQNSKHRDQFVREGLADEQRTRVLPGSGIDLKRFVPVALPAEDELSFLMIARLLKAKGVREYVTAAGALLGEGAKARFRLLGAPAEGPDSVDPAEIDAWRTAGAIDYLGAAPDVRPFIAAADCIVLPSYTEGTPRTLLEGAAMGRPLIASNIPGCNQVIDEGVNGLLCRAQDSHALADAMRKMLALSPAARASMGAASRDKVEREFDEKLVIQAYLDALAAAGVTPSG